MSVFFCEEPVYYGGTRQSTWIRIVADKIGDLLAFNRRYHGYTGLLPKDLRDALTTAGRWQGKMPLDLALKVKQANEQAIKLNLTLPDVTPNMYRTKTPIRILIRETQASFLGALEIPALPEKYLPLLNMMLRREYTILKGQFKPEDPRDKEIDTYFNREIRGKKIDLLRSGQWVDEPTDPAIMELNQYIRENLDRGRRSDLNYSSSQSEKSDEVTEKYARGKSSALKNVSRDDAPIISREGDKPWMRNSGQ